MKQINLINSEYFVQKRGFAQREERIKLEQRVLTDRNEMLENEIISLQKSQQNGKPLTSYFNI